MFSLVCFSLRRSTDWNEIKMIYNWAEFLSSKPYHLLFLTISSALWHPWLFFSHTFISLSYSCELECESHSVVSNSLRPNGYTVHGILQARILQWVAFPFSRRSSQFRDQTQVSHIADGFFPSWAYIHNFSSFSQLLSLKRPLLFLHSFNIYNRT